MKKIKKNIIIFDDHCILCHFFFQFLIKRDQNKFHYTGSHSNFSKKLYKKNPILNKQTKKTIVLLNDSEYHFKSAAVILILKQIGYPWKVLFVLKIFPRSWLDSIYDIISKNRHRIGKKECSFLTGNKQEKILK